MKPTMRIYAVLAPVACLLFLLAGCATPPVSTPVSETEPLVVPFDELIAGAAQYAGQEICTEGISVDAFEAIALGASTYERNGAIFLTEPTIWIASASREVIGDCQELATGGEIKFCQERVCGVFHAGDQYGHTGNYQYELSNE